MRWLAATQVSSIYARTRRGSTRRCFKSETGRARTDVRSARSSEGRWSECGTSQPGRALQLVSGTSPPRSQIEAIEIHPRTHHVELSDVEPDWMSVPDPYDVGDSESA